MTTCLILYKYTEQGIKNIEEAGYQDSARAHFNSTAVAADDLGIRFANC
jgi:uncharacterized protein with GYD domain